MEKIEQSYIPINSEAQVFFSTEISILRAEAIPIDDPYFDDPIQTLKYKINRFIDILDKLSAMEDYELVESDIVYVWKEMHAAILSSLQPDVLSHCIENLDLNLIVDRQNRKELSNLLRTITFYLPKELHVYDENFYARSSILTLIMFLCSDRTQFESIVVNITYEDASNYLSIQSTSYELFTARELSESRKYNDFMSKKAKRKMLKLLQGFKLGMKEIIKFEI